MSVTATTVQSNINFGGVIPGTSGPDITPVSDLPSFNGSVEIRSAPADAMLSVTLTGDTDHFAVRDIYIMEWVSEIWHPDDNGEGPPPGHGGSPTGPPARIKVLEVVNFSDGKTPVAVKQDQYVLVRTAYSAGFLNGAFTANLIIQGDTWDTITIPLSLFTAEIKTVASDVLNIAQGGTASLPFILRSVIGPAVDVHYEMSVTQLHNGLNLTPNNFSLLPFETKLISLEFTADKDAPIGLEQVAIEQFAFRPLGFFFNANIVHAQVTINPLIPNNIFILKRGDSFKIPISVQLNNGPAVDIMFSPAGLPPNVFISEQSFQFEADQVIHMTMNVGQDVPDDFSFSIGWATQWSQTGTMNFTVTIPKPIILRTDVTTADGIALGGWVELTVSSDGNYTFKGSMEASGLPSYNYGLQVFIKAADGVVIAAFHSGSVFGLDTPGDRNNSWEENLNSPLLTANWMSIMDHHWIEYSLRADMGGVTGTLWDILKIGLEAFLAFIVSGPAGAVIVIGNELVSATGIPTSPGLVAGIVVAEGMVLVFGTGVIVPAVISGVAVGTAVELSIKNRPIHPEEMDFARLIFGTTLDERFNENKIWITNLSHDGGRKFTIPGPDRLILLNLDNAFDNPVTHYDASGDYTQPGSVFAHELTHACQIVMNNFVPGMICNISQNYDYHNIPNSEADRLTDKQWASLSWEDDFTLEQQAHIVDDWYGAFCNKFNDLAELENNLNTEKALSDPAFQFIIKCRAGIF